MGMNGSKRTWLGFIIPLLVTGLFGTVAEAEEGTVSVSRVAIRVRLHDFIDPEGSQPKVRATATWYGKGKVEPRSVEISSADTALDLPPGRWSLQAEAPGYWGNPEFLELSTEPKEVALDLWPAGIVEGGFLQAEGEQTSAQLEVFFRPAPGGSHGDSPPPAKNTCLVEKGTWRCTVPAGVLDLRFQAQGFIPRYQWGVTVPRQEAVRLGKFDLVRGSAVLGWVVTVDRSPIAKGARIELRPRMSGPVSGGRDRGGRLESLTFEAPVNERGFFQIDGVPAGSYVLEASQAPFAPSRVTVQVLPGEVTEVANPPVVLDFPKALEIVLNPPLDPDGKPWSVELAQLDRNTMEISKVAATIAGEDGSWKKTGLSQGSYMVRIGSYAGDTWHRQQIEVDESPVPLFIDLEVVQVVGTVKLGESPLAALLTFGGPFGATRIKAKSDEDGRFELALPRAGDWTVHVSSEAPPVLREVPKVPINPRPGKTVAEVELNLPDTWLRGRVVDESDKRVAGAIVNVKTTGSTVEPQVQARSDDEGKFEIFGLPAGPLLVGAEAAGDRSSDRITVQLSEGEESASVVLKVRPQVRITGTLVSATGPVTGGKVKAAPVGVPYFTVRTTTSDAQGRFEVFLPPAAREMFLAVAAPGFALRMLRLPVTEKREITLGVEQMAGTLILESDVPLATAEPEDPYVVIFHKGSLEALPLLSAWAMMSGETPESPTRSKIPNVEPGDYRACWMLPAEKAGFDLGVVPQGRCADGFVSVNGTVTLKLPNPPSSQGREGSLREP